MESARCSVRIRQDQEGSWARWLGKHRQHPRAQTNQWFKEARKKTFSARLRGLKQRRVCAATSYLLIVPAADGALGVCFRSAYKHPGSKIERSSARRLLLLSTGYLQQNLWLTISNTQHGPQNLLYRPWSQTDQSEPEPSVAEGPQPSAGDFPQSWSRFQFGIVRK